MIRNFIFHRISPEVIDPLMEIDLGHFEKCIAYIRKHYEVILVEDIHENAGSRNKPLATLSFDDGYLDNFLYAAPVLEKYNCRGTFFIVSECVEEQKPLWVTTIQYLLFKNDISGMNFNFDFLPADLRAGCKPNSGHHKAMFIRKMNNCLKKLPVNQKDLIYNYITDSCSDLSLPRMMMNWQELAQLKEKGHYIGAHSHTHNNLTVIKDDAQLAEEFILPRQLIQQNLGYSPAHSHIPLAFATSV